MVPMLKVMSRLGGCLRLSISGGAALPPKVSRLFIALGLPLVQGYNGLQTPTLKLKRARVIARYEKEIAHFYEGH